MSDFTPTDLQARVLREVKAWLASYSATRLRYLSGYAGTGKTTLLRHIVESLNGRALFGAFTGKAAQVMRSKGCTGAATLHSLAYRFNRHTEEFEIWHDGPLSTCSLLVIDECSMVDAKLGADVLSFGCKVLAVGDPAQLPPVSGTGYFTSGIPDWVLDEVHRQALDSGVLRLATELRETGEWNRAPGAYGDDVAIVGFDAFSEVDQYLVGMNRTRHEINAAAREGRPRFPIIGDRLVCLRNDVRRALLNGELWTASADAEEFGSSVLLRATADEGGAEFFGTAHREPLLGGPLAEEGWSYRRLHSEFAYAYAITVHKGQGSSWPSVGLVDESNVFREDRTKWLYTAVTRSEKKLKILKTW